MFHRFPELGDDAAAWSAPPSSTHREDPAGAVLEQIAYRGYRKDLATGTTASRAVPPLS